MATQIIHASDMFTVDVTVRESEPYSEQVYMKLEMNYGPEKVYGTHEVFLTPVQLELLGRFLIRQADNIQSEQAIRKTT